MNPVFIVTLVCVVFILMNTNTQISTLQKGKHDVTSLIRDVENIQDVPIDKVGIYKTDNQNASWAHDFKSSSIREILNTDDANARLQYKTDMIDDTHPLCDVIKKHFPSCRRKVDRQLPHYTVRVCSKNWEFKSHFDCGHNKVICLCGNKRFLVFDLYDNHNELDILKYTKNMPIDTLKTFLVEQGITVHDHYLEPGDELYIKPTMYHRVESSDSSIIMGYSPPFSDMEYCTNKFDEFWPKQGKLCDTNRCVE